MHSRGGIDQQQQTCIIDKKTRRSIAVTCRCTRPCAELDPRHENTPFPIRNNNRVEAWVFSPQIYNQNKQVINSFYRAVIFPFLSHWFLSHLFPRLLFLRCLFLSLAFLSHPFLSYLFLSLLFLSCLFLSLAFLSHPFLNLAFLSLLFRPTEFISEPFISELSISEPPVSKPYIPLAIAYIFSHHVLQPS